MYKRLSGKTLFVTGASSGIGRAVVEGAIACDAKVIACARRDNLLQEIKDSLIEEYGEEKGNNMLVRKLDVSDRDMVKEVVANLPVDFKNIDVLINNAGLSKNNDLTYEFNEDDIDIILDVNVKGTFYCINAIVPQMIERDVTCHVINVGSIAGHEAFRRGSVYCASKHAVHALTSSLMKELAHTKINVSEICPGLVKTDFFSERNFSGNSRIGEIIYKGLENLVPEDIADCILFTASRPNHVQLAQMTIFPSAQASCEIMARTENNNES